MKVLLLFNFLACCLVLSSAASTKLAAFNIQVFGQSKSSEPTVMSDLVQILKRYDITLIQEIRDSAGTAIDELLEDLNVETGGAYSKVISERLGRTSSKEQYCYFFKHSLYSVIKTDTYTDSPIDKFEREPYSVEFLHRTTRKKFVLSGLHAKPDDAVAEIDAMVDVYDDIISTFGNTNVIMMGDFNADCSYVRESDWPNIRLRQYSTFYWPLGDGVDTTVSSTDCAYDRFVIAGDMITPSSIEASVYNFESMSGLQSDPKDVSDHYPIEIILTL